MLKRATVATSSAFNRLSAHIMYLHKPILKENFGFYENKIICSYCTRTYIYMTIWKSSIHLQTAQVKIKLQIIDCNG